MDTSTRKLIAAAGGLVAAVGLLVGFFPVSKNGISCGSAFDPSGEGDVQDIGNAMYNNLATSFGAACEDSLQTWRLIAIALLVIGIGVAAIMIPRRQAPSKSGQPREPSAS